MWHEITLQHPSPESELYADVQVPAESPWFQGHFPANPVLPGIAQLGMVFDVIRKSLRTDLRVVQVSRVRFKQMVRPEDRLTLRVFPKAGRSGWYAFRLVNHEELVCLGDIRVEPAG